jgi:hypothetical protein
MASGPHELEAFVRTALERGCTKPEIQSALAQAGWPAEQIRSVVSAFADISFPVPVPKPRTRISAREAFLYLVLYTTLYISAYYLGDLSFELIERAFPDPAASPAWNWRSPNDQIRWAVSSIVVAFPIFLYLSTYLYREIARNPAKRLSPTRRWLTYLTLFVAAAFLIGDLTTLVYNALGGELTIRFALKVIVVGAIAGTIFGYYLRELRREEREE